MSPRCPRFVTPDNLLRAWTMSQTMGRPYSQIVGLDGIEAYALDAAVVRWGTAFDNAVRSAANGAKNQQEAERKAETAIRRWIPSSRRYR